VVLAGAKGTSVGAGAFSWVTTPPPCALIPTPGNPTPCGIADFPTFQVAALVTPEPGFYGLLAIGIAGLWIGAVRRDPRDRAKRD
jgi:hypothetical protein